MPRRIACWHERLYLHLGVGTYVRANAKWIKMVVVVCLLITGILIVGILFAQQKHRMSKSDQNALNYTNRSFITLAAEADLTEIQIDDRARKPYNLSTIRFHPTRSGPGAATPYSLGG